MNLIHLSSFSYTLRTMTFKKTALSLVLVAFLFLAVWVWRGSGEDKSLPGFTDRPSESTSLPTPAPTSSRSISPKDESLLLIQVPFTSQAPFGEWSDDRFQDGCEEASVMMAAYWLRGKSITPDKAREEIIAISKYETDIYGDYHDTSAQDTADRILKGYYGHSKYVVKYDFEAQDIINVLEEGKIAILPMNGQILGNPNYTAPGPDRHMLVVIGYDPDLKQFITNDPGTRLGKSYRYSVNKFMSSIRDYPTGEHAPITQVRKAMIIVSK